MNYNKKTEGSGRCLKTGYSKTVHPFRALYKVAPGKKNSGNMRPTLFVGWGEGQGMYELENAPEIQKYPKTFVHDCSLPSSFLLRSVFVSRISKSEPGQ